MQTKLTLRVEEDLINAAKIYSSQHGKSLSKLIADYFYLLTTMENKSLLKVIPPITKSLKGILSKTTINEDDYKKYLEDKFL